MTALLYNGYLVSPPASRLDVATTKDTATPEASDFVSNSRRGVVWLDNAGTGKSTALLHRLTELQCEYGVAANSITVLTPTSASCEALSRTYRRGVEAIGTGSNAPATRAVQFSTFSDLATELARSYLAADIQVVDAPRSPCNRASDTGSALHRRLIEEAFNACFDAYPEFSDTLLRLLLDSFVSAPRDAGEPDVMEASGRIAAALQIDGAFSRSIEEDWASTGLWPIPGVDTRDECGRPFNVSIDGFAFTANGYIRALDVYVVLGARSVVRERRITRGDASCRTLGRLTWTKTQLFLGRSNKRVRVVSTVAELQCLAAQVTAIRGLGASRTFTFLVPWIGSKEWIPIAESLFRMGAQVEHQGEDPRSPQAVGAALSISAPMASVTSQFYECFYRALDARRVETVNRIFLKLTASGGWLAHMPLDALARLQHVFIDDIQAALPVHLALVFAAHQRLSSDTHDCYIPSVSGTGDPRQDVTRHGSHEPLSMDSFLSQRGITVIRASGSRNIRSPRSVASCAHLIGDAVPSSRDAKHAWVPGRFGCMDSSTTESFPLILVERFQKGDIERLVCLLLETMRADTRLLIVTLNHDDPAIAATAAALASIDDARLNVVAVEDVLGLEAEYVVLIGDAPRSLDRARADALDARPRFVAYTGLTRARDVCIWFSGRFRHGTSNLLPDDPPMARRTDIAGLLKSLVTTQTRPRN